MVFLPPSYATALLAVLIPVFIVLRRFNAADPYGLFHLELNREDGDPEICTEWLNMGFWRDTLSFPKAAEALAAKTISGVEENCRGKVLGMFQSFIAKNVHNFGRRRIRHRGIYSTTTSSSSTSIQYCWYNQYTFSSSPVPAPCPGIAGSLPGVSDDKGIAACR